MSLFSSWFTAPGSSMASQLENEQQYGITQGYNLLKGISPGLQSEAAFSNSQQPVDQQAIQNLEYLSSPAANLEREQLHNANEASSAAQLANSAASTAGAAGQTGGFTGGNSLAASDMANASDNAFANQLNNPDTTLQNSENMIQAANQGMGLPDLSSLGSLSSLMDHSPAIQVGEGAGQMIGGLLGNGIQGALQGIPAGGVIGDFLGGL